MIGLAIGDAVRATLEFQYRNMYPPVENMVGGEVHDLKPEQWTDDTSMALCLGYSLKEKGFDVDDQLGYKYTLLGNSAISNLFYFAVP